MIKIWNTDTDKCIATLEGHTKGVWCVKMLSENKMLSCSSDSLVKLWDLNDVKCLKTFKGHSKTVFCIDIISKCLIATGSSDKLIKIWNTGNLNLIKIASLICFLLLNNVDTGADLKTLKGHNGAVNCLKVSNDKLKLISGSEDKTIKIWSIDTGACLKTLTGHTNNVWSLQLIKSETLLSSATDGTIKYWNFDSGNCIKTIIDENEESAIMSIQAF